MKISSLHLEKYRCFENLNIDFDTQLTVLVGSNGSGKTSILDALSLFLRQIGHPNSKGTTLTRIPASDAGKNIKTEKIIYNVKFTWSGNENSTINSLDFIFERKNDNPAFFSVKNNDIPALAMQWVKFKKNLDNDYPLCVAYMAGRSIPENIPKNSLAFKDLSSPTAAYDKAFERTIDYEATLRWFDSVDADEARVIRDKGPKYKNPQLDAVREALSKALLDQYERPRMQGSPPELIVYKKGTDIFYKVNQLSDGYRSMLALIMDLARRMALSHNNDMSNNESILTTNAIVVIDEVELHLHPLWQQTVLTTLIDIFPNTQFIVTTHSPQVLTSILPKHIRILNDGQAYLITEQTKGAEASQLLKYVFDVDVRPQYLDVVQELNEYEKLVYEDNWGSPRAEELQKKLEKHFGGDDLKLMELGLYVENAKWERGL